MKAKHKLSLYVCHIYWNLRWGAPQPLPPQQHRDPPPPSFGFSLKFCVCEGEEVRWGGRWLLWLWLWSEPQKPLQHLPAAPLWLPSVVSDLLPASLPFLTVRYCLALAQVWNTLNSTPCPGNQQCQFFFLDNKNCWCCYVVWQRLCFHLL